jgi:hypothetical protein
MTIAFSRFFQREKVPEGRMREHEYKARIANLKSKTAPPQAHDQMAAPSPAYP